MASFAPPPPIKSKTSPLSPLTALRVMRPPQSIGVMLTNETPRRVFWQGQSYTVQEIAGPWRVNGQWWNEANWCREEWDVRLVNETSERVCKIAFDPHLRQWYVQGTYD
jgi:protein ImuB